MESNVGNGWWQNYAKLIIQNHIFSYSFVNAAWQAAEKLVRIWLKQPQPKILEIANKQHTPVEIRLQTMANPSPKDWYGVAIPVGCCGKSGAKSSQRSLPIQNQLWLPWPSISIDISSTKIPCILKPDRQFLPKNHHQKHGKKKHMIPPGKQT